MGSGRQISGSTQSDNPLASAAGPFNPLTSSTLKQVDPDKPNQTIPVHGLSCAVDPTSGANNALYCLSRDEGIAMQLSNFSLSQRFFSVYDGPAYQESNAYLDIHPTYLTSTSSFWIPSRNVYRTSSMMRRIR